MEGIWLFSEDSKITRQLLTLGAELGGAMQKPVCALTINVLANKNADSNRFLSCRIRSRFIRID